MKSIFTLFFIFISKFLFSQETKIEAESGTKYGVTVATARAGFSGSGYVSGFDADADSLVLIFNSTGGLHEIFVGFSTPNGQKGFDIDINKEKATGTFQSNSGFVEMSIGKFSLINGNNRVRFQKGWGWYDIDYIRVKKAVPSTLKRPDYQLTNPLATNTSKSLMAYLIDHSGEVLISAQQDMADINYIAGITGKTPAMGAFDLIEYSPSRILYGANPGQSVENWITWSQQNNAMVTLAWHWNAPTDLINTTGKEWWRGFYTMATTFDFKAALDNPDGEKYKLIISDIDKIAIQLKKFQAADIPVLWRPLHEASGGWFWWGAKGDEAYIRLWRLLYDRLVNYHQIHNLIWVYTAGTPSWYPGDDVVDIVSLDIYTDANSSMSNEWENILALFNGKKLITLSESGTLPNPEKVQTYSTWWSYFCVWSGDFIRNINIVYLSQVFTHQKVITLDELGNWRTYDFSNHEPRIDGNQNFICLKTAVNGTQIGKVIATDRDENQQLTFSISEQSVAGLIEINAADGTILLADASKISALANTEISLNVAVVDNGSPSKSNEETVTVLITETSNVNAFNIIQPFFRIFPNVTDSVIRIEYEILKASDVRISIFDTKGTLVENIKSGFCQTGFHTFEYNCSKLKPQTYFVTFEAGGVSKSLKFIKVK